MPIPTVPEFVIGTLFVACLLLALAMLMDIFMTWLKDWVVVRRWRVSKRVNRAYQEYLRRQP